MLKDPDKKNTKNILVAVRLNDDDAKMLAEICKNSGLTISKTIRALIQKAWRTYGRRQKP